MGIHFDWVNFLTLFTRRKQRRCRLPADRHRKLRFEQCEPRRVLAPIIVNNPGDFIDSNLNVTTLREAIAIANQIPDHDTITFDPAVFNTPKTISLTQGQLAITQSVTIDGTIDGTGPSNVLLGITIDGSGSDPTPNSTFNDGISTNDGDGILVFNITGEDVELRGLTITGGDSNSQAGGIVVRADNDRWSSYRAHGASCFWQDAIV